MSSLSSSTHTVGETRGQEEMTDVIIWSILSYVIWPYIVILLVYLAAWIDERLSKEAE